ncbi:hypothetical protein FQN53_008687 [Emmonsiellopsis sp. PD_33]|nr:hypothetical protein FQN53_008687 [Emmonsiellopsis sp. PD_33]KAK2796341.1 hypothetical protein FQN51_009431 [Onygenales sp. PD_10]
MHNPLSYLGLTLTLSGALVSALKIAASLEVIEYTPAQIAIEDYYDGNAEIIDGSVATLLNDTSFDLATNAETQALREYGKNKSLRIIWTIAEVTYRIVGRASAGISTLEDLKGKKIGAIPSTSAAYFVEKYLGTIGLTTSDYNITYGKACLSAPCPENSLPSMLAAGSVDAVGIWEPTLELAIEAIGDDAVVFQDPATYRELFNLHSTVEKLSDPAIRSDIVEFIRSLYQAEKVFESDPESIWPRAAAILGMDVGVLEAVWPTHNFTTTLATDLMQALAEEDQWIANLENRSPLSEEELAQLVDTSVLEEVLGA